MPPSPTATKPWPLTPEGVPLTVETIPGIGSRTLPHLHTYGIRTVGDAMAYAERNACPDDRRPPLRTERLRTFSLCRFIASCAVPSDDAIVSHDHVEKSISRDRTFGADTADQEMLNTVFAEWVKKNMTADDLEKQLNIEKYHAQPYGTWLRREHPIVFHRAVTIASENEKGGKCTTTKR